jgi:hypothetical protein
MNNFVVEQQQDNYLKSIILNKQTKLDILKKHKIPTINKLYVISFDNSFSNFENEFTKLKKQIKDNYGHNILILICGIKIDMLPICIANKENLEHIEYILDYYDRDYVNKITDQDIKNYVHELKYKNVIYL